MSRLEPRGAFISLEGGDGAGKSTAIAALATVLEQQGIAFKRLREPGGTATGEAIRELLLQRHDLAIAPHCELLLMFAARAQLLAQEIEPALGAGMWVLCDRYTDSSFAYQSAGRGLAWDLVAELEQRFAARQPDLTVLLDVAPETALQRRLGSSAPDRIEREALSFFAAVRAGFLRRAKEAPARVQVIDAAQAQPQVIAAVTQALRDFLQQRHAHA